MFVCFFLLCFLQTDKGPEQEGGHSEAQGASGEEPECTADGGGTQAGG